MASFEFTPTPLPGLTVARRERLGDHRGFLSRLYCAEQFKLAGVYAPIAQINQTLTRQSGTVRGMHFQLSPHAEIKIVSCLHGEIFDVAVDLRRNSPTFLHWHAEVLSAENQRCLVIPQGYAHGFQTLTDDCELLYLHTAAYAPEAERGLNATDPRLSIAWPLAISERSPRDYNHDFLTSDFQGLDL
jgi:dTDP-4-dehydrorhamnose 3,5-epimerase